MNLQTVNELTHLYTALNPSLQAEKSNQPEIKEINPVLVKIEDWLGKSISQMREGIRNPFKNRRMLTTK